MSPGSGASGVAMFQQQQQMAQNPFETAVSNQQNQSNSWGTMSSAHGFGTAGNVANSYNANQGNFANQYSAGKPMTGQGPEPVCIWAGVFWYIQCIQYRAATKFKHWKSECICS